MAEMIIVACVETGDYMGCGTDYVRNLYEMVKRNTTVPFRFYVLTDSSDRHLDLLNDAPAMTVTLVPTQESDWWAKMDLFKEGMFLPGSRIVYFDLDTIIVGNIDRLLTGEKGDEETTLRELHRTPAFLGNWRTGGWPLSTAAMVFMADELAEVYSEWRRQGWPITRWGDDEFVRNAVNHLNIGWSSLQHQFPFFASYKFHKLAQRGLSPNDRIICFVQRPKPHELREEWASAWGYFTLRVEPTSPIVDASQTVSSSAVPPLSDTLESGRGEQSPRPATEGEGP